MRNVVPLANHEIASAVMAVVFAAAIVVPFGLSWRFGWKVGVVAAVVWSIAGFCLFYFLLPSPKLADAIGVALVVFLGPWLLAAFFASRLRRRVSTR